jgi:3-hydroxybutyryl-CoA dehydrogenase
VTPTPHAALSPLAVIGAGTIGSGVAQAAAQAGLTTVVIDVSSDALRRCREAIEQGVRMQRLFGKGRAAAADVLARLCFSRDYEALAPAAFVVENVTEAWDVKRAVYRELDQRCRPDVIIAANTSVMPINRLASVVRCPERVIGVHFMNPVALIGTVELVLGERTSAEATDITKRLLRLLAKEWVEVRDSPGFVSNRVLMLTINEAAFTLQERLAPAAEIDRIFTDCFGHKMGPLASADLIGVDTVLLSLDGLYEAFGDPKFRPCPLLRQMVWSGRCGRKTGAGFFEYADTGGDDAGWCDTDPGAADIRCSRHTSAVDR